MSKHFNVVVIGAGPGGYVAALKAASMGAKTAIVEKHFLGGTCLNYGCIPSKALLASAELLHKIERAAEFGVKVNGASFDWKAIQARKDRVLKNLRNGIAGLFKARKVELFEGMGRLAGHGKVEIEGKETITADNIILAVGSIPVRIPVWPQDPNLVCTSDEALHWSELPKKLLIVGGGVIGCEFACMMQSYGVDVSVVEMLPSLLPGMDEDLGAELEKALAKRGIKIFTATKVESVEAAGKGVRAAISNAKGNQSLEVDKVLVAVGRRPNTKNIGLDSVGMELSPKGFIQVDDTMQTAVKGIYCIGDANGRCLLAHAASAQGICAVENALGHRREFHSPIPGAVYTYPEIGGVGLTESQAREKGLPISIGKFPIGFLGKAMAVNETEGFVKIIRNRETDELLGMHILGHNATEIIAVGGAMLGMKATVMQLAETVFAHPTISEAVMESAEDALGQALHMPPRKIIKLNV